MPIHTHLLILAFDRTLKDRVMVKIIAYNEVDLVQQEVSASLRCLLLEE